MSDRDWDAELRKIDRQMEKAGERPALPPVPGGAPMARGPERPMAAGAAGGARPTTAFGVYGRLSLAVALGVGIIFWPYAARCGWGLSAYLGATVALVVSGVWASVWTWRHRAPSAHVLSLLLALWGMTLAATEVLPRVGYAIPTVSHPATWGCAG